MRAGKGKLRNRRRVQKLGPLVIYDQDQVNYSLISIHLVTKNIERTNIDSNLAFYVFGC